MNNMIAHREFIKPQNGMLLIPVPEDMKAGSLFDVFITVATPQETLSKEVSPLDFKTLAGRFRHITDEKLQELDTMRNEWERDF